MSRGLLLYNLMLLFKDTGEQTSLTLVRVSEINRPQSLGQLFLPSFYYDFLVVPHKTAYGVGVVSLAPLLHSCLKTRIDIFLLGSKILVVLMLEKQAPNSQQKFQGHISAHSHGSVFFPVFF